MGKPSDSAVAYDRAIKANSGEPTAWKGLLRLYASTNESEKYLDAFIGVTKAFEANNDIMSAGVEFNKAVKFITFKGSNSAKKRFLEMQLPSSELYSFLHPRSPDIGQTLSRLINLTEKEEKEAINKHASKNKLRIGASSDGKTEEKFQWDTYSSSRLPDLYHELINSTMDDDLRRETEVKLFNYRYKMLMVSPPDAKEELRSEVVELASGMVVVRANCPLAWAVYLDWQDPKSLSDLEYDNIAYYINNFPNEGLAKVLLGFVKSEISPISFEETGAQDAEQSDNADVTDQKADNGESSEKKTQWTPDLVLELMTEGFESDSQRVLSHRIMTAFYLRLQEYETAVDIAHRGIELAKKLDKSAAVKLSNARLDFSLGLATAYIYYQAPKNFEMAIQIFDRVLTQDGENVTAKIGKGLILRERGKLEEALNVLQDVVAKHPDNFQALVEYSWCQVLVGDGKGGRKGLSDSLKFITAHDPQSLDQRSQIWWRIGVSHWNDRDKSTSEANDAFDCFVKSLQSNPNYAPAYTSLGFFYADVMGDSTRATKCFYKAFEIDGGEIEAAEQLAREFARKGDWDLVDIVAGRVADSDKIRTHTGSDSSWAFRALGIVALNHRDYAKAVTHFQKALRLAPRDTNSWVGLGEAYSNSGRHVSAEKAFYRALDIDPTNIIARYQLGLVQRDLHQHADAIETFKTALNESPEDLKIPSYLIESYLASARNNIDREFYGEAASDAVHSLKSALDALNDGFSTQGIWQSIAGALEVFLFIHSSIQRLPTDVAVKIFEHGHQLYPELESEIMVDEAELQDHLSRKSALARSVILACQFALGAAGKDSSSRALAFYNIGLAYLKTHLWWLHDTDEHRDDDDYLQDAIKFLKKAIQTEPRNPQIWNLYGIAASEVNAKVAQHCYIRSLGLNYRQPAAWTNLAALYMANDDLELASEALDKAQALDPDYVSCWVGQGLIVYIKGNQERASNIFEHSYEISRGGDLTAKLLHGLVTYEQAMDEKNLGKGRILNLDSAILALHKYCMTSPDDDLGILLQSSLLERSGAHSKGVEQAESLAKLYEDRFEISESENDLINFAKAKTLLARLHLGEHEYSNAVEDASFVLSLLDDEDQRPHIRKARLSALLTAGLGSYFLKTFDESLGYFERALAVSQEDQSVIILLVQVLWAHGGDNERAVALDHLFSSISTKGASVDATVLLGVIGLLSDSSLIEPAVEELENLPLSELEKDNKNYVQEVLALIRQSMAPWQKAAALWPTNYGIWKNLDPQVALHIACSHPQRTSLLELSKAYARADTSLQGAQRSVFLAPSAIHGWKHLNSVLQV